MCTQTHSIGFNTRSKAFRYTQAHWSAFNHIHTHSKAFVRAQFHLGITSKVHSVMFGLTQRHSRTLKHVQSHSILTQRHSCALKCIQLYSAVFNWVQLGSLLAQRCSSALKCVQWWSLSLKGIQSGQKNKGPMDMCLNMWSMRKPHRFALNVHWMFFNVQWLYRFTKRRMTSNVNIGKRFVENEIGDEK
jgi:hypothetical protein